MKLDCGHEPSPHSDFTTGYGATADGKKHCYAYIAEMDKNTMIETGHSRNLPLYLCFNENNSRGEKLARGYHPCGSRHIDTWQVTNWPGSLRFNAYVTTGSHNIAGKRYDVWFNGPDGLVWHGTQYGDMTQIVHCKRTKRLNAGKG